MKKTVSVMMILLMIFAVAPVLYAGPSEQRIERRIHELQARIDEGTRSGSLTAAESGKLQSRLDRIRDHFEKARAKRYGLGDGETRTLDAKLDNLRKDVYKEKHDVQTTRSNDRIMHRINELQRRIEAGSRDGSLTGTEARSLQHRLDNVRKQLEQAQSGGSMSDQRIKAAEHNLDRISQDINRERHDRQRAR
jgi:septal ring factor EnvC (AmiA/AmiB activator)